MLKPIFIIMLLSMGLKFRSAEAKVESCLNVMHELQMTSLKDHGKLDKTLIDSAKSPACEFIELKLIEKNKSTFLVVATYMKQKWQINQKKELMKINEE